MTVYRENILREKIADFFLLGLKPPFASHSYVLYIGCRSE